MFLYKRDFATQDNKMWYDLSDSYSIEGGDVLVLSKDIVAVGLSERTTVSGAETFARNLLQNSDFKKVLAFDIPETRAFMHLPKDKDVFGKDNEFFEFPKSFH